MSDTRTLKEMLVRMSHFGSRCVTTMILLSLGWLTIFVFGLKFMSAWLAAFILIAMPLAIGIREYYLDARQEAEAIVRRAAEVARDVAGRWGPSVKARDTSEAMYEAILADAGLEAKDE